MEANGLWGVCVYMRGESWTSRQALEKSPITRSPLSWDSRRVLVSLGEYLAG